MKGADAGARQTWVQILPPPLCRSEILGMLFHLSEPQFPYLQYGHKNTYLRASLVVQWLRICLPMQGTRVQALVWEDPTCRGATRPVSHNC